MTATILANVSAFGFHRNGNPVILWCEGIHRVMVGRMKTGDFNYPQGIVDLPADEPQERITLDDGTVANYAPETNTWRIVNQQGQHLHNADPYDYAGWLPVVERDRA